MNRRTRAGFLFTLAFIFATAAGRAQTLQADVSLLQAFHQSNSTGFSADFGESIAGRQFLGLEFTLFNPSFNYSYPTLGAAHVDERVESVQVAYRFSFPLSFSSGDRKYAPLELYIGAAGGLGRVRQTLTLSSNVGGASGTQLSAQETELCGELAGGLQFNFGPNFGIRAGFRYLDSINNVKLFNTDAATDTKALEAGVVFRF
jgi:opacity protein-like surface antigen